MSHDPQPFLNDISNRRGKQDTGWNPVWFLELNGANVIEPIAFEPDPTTHRNNYYYNCTTNILYKKVISRKESGIVVASWVKIS